jgi:hypothetical protein
MGHAHHPVQPDNWRNKCRKSSCFRIGATNRRHTQWTENSVVEQTSLLFLEFPPGKTRSPVIHADTLSGPGTQLQSEPASSFPNPLHAYSSTALSHHPARWSVCHGSPHRALHSGGAHPSIGGCALDLPPQQLFALLPKAHHHTTTGGASFCDSLHRTTMLPFQLPTPESGTYSRLHGFRPNAPSDAVRPP